MTQKQEVTKAKTKLPAAVVDTAWGADSVDGADIMIPKLLLMQGLSQAVADGEAQMGGIVDSVTYEELGSGREKDAKPVSIIPLTSYKEWVVYEKLSDGKVQFKEIVKHGPSNSHWEKDTPEERRDLVLNFYVMLADTMDDPTALPYLLSFRRTSYTAGRKLSSHFSKCQMASARGTNVPPAATIFSLTAKKVQNDMGTYYVFDVAPGGKTPDTALATAYEWWKTLGKNEHRVDNSDIVVTEEGDEEEDQV